VSVALPSLSLVAWENWSMSLRFWSPFGVLIVSLTIQGCASAPVTPAAAPAPAAPTSATAGGTTLVAIAAPPVPTAPLIPPLPELLGINAAFKGIGGIGRHLGGFFRNRVLGGRFPGLEPKPPIKSITDPANMGEDASPAAKAAAESKQAEDGAAQEIKAVAYLASIGCGGCYPDVESAIISALEDCNEGVRYAAVKGLRDSAGTACSGCKSDRCCSPAILKALDKLTNEKGTPGCPAEPSARVRRLARLAMAGCGGGVTPRPTEGPKEPEPVDEEAEQTAQNDAFGNSTSVLAMPAKTDTSAASTIVSTSFSESTNSLVSLQGNPSDTVVARVNHEPIMESQLRRQIESQLDRQPDTADLNLSDSVYEQLFRAELTKAIEQKLLLQEARKHQSPVNRLSPLRTSKQQRASQWLRHAARPDERISPTQRAAFFREHRSMFYTPAECRWERVSVSNRDFGSPKKAYTAISYFRDRSLGRKVTPLELSPETIHIENSKMTPISDVAQVELRNVLTRLQIGRVSRIMPGDDGWFILRVIDRKPGRNIPQAEVDATTRKQILQQRRQLAERQYVDQLRHNAVIWTPFDTTRPSVASAAPSGNTVTKIAYRRSAAP